MVDKKKGKGLSRRSFLKGLGGGAIGTAVISTGLASRLEAVGIRRRAPKGLTKNGYDVIVIGAGSAGKSVGEMASGAGGARAHGDEGFSNGGGHDPGERTG